MPATVPRRWGARPREVSELVEAGLWEPAEVLSESGWLFHDWAQYNDPRELDPDLRDAIGHAESSGTYLRGSLPFRVDGTALDVLDGAGVLSREPGTGHPKCVACGQEFPQVAGCAAMPYPTAYRWGDESYWHEPAMAGWEPKERCTDCLAQLGQPHHLGCCKAFCSICQDQAICCEHAP